MLKNERRIPPWVKIVYSSFVALLVPIYWIDYGPTNFLYFCDVALLLTVHALWAESRPTASIALVGILVPQTVWIVDFLAHCFGLTLVGATEYMFDRGIPLFTRFLSFFHFWLPLFLLYVVGRLGYDRRALRWCTLGGWLILLVSYFLLPAPPAPVDNPNLPVNVNYVYGMSDKASQTAMAPSAYLALLMCLLPIVAYVPAHLILKRWFEKHTAPMA
ncbi:MAG: hypothetical protein K8U03_02675 [Planctomycetia bacterium]|nr:hypothetical protein [Planctomycetia bacterium]